jgi:hypothetical protein
LEGRQSLVAGRAAVQVVKRVGRRRGEADGKASW